MAHLFANGPGRTGTPRGRFELEPLEDRSESEHLNSIISAPKLLTGVAKSPSKVWLSADPELF